MDKQKLEVTSTDLTRRRLLIATSAVGGAAAIATAYPFVASMAPSERERAASSPVEVDISKLGDGELMTTAWRGKPVWILHRTSEMVARLKAFNMSLADPESEVPQQPVYCKNPYRSRKPEYFVAVGLCTHLGCVPSFRKEVAPADLGPNWPGGFFCPCHGSKFDLAGRVFKNVPAPSNLEVPLHAYVGDARLLIGKDDNHEQ